MKMTLKVIVTALLLLDFGHPSPLFAQGTAFTYQGLLQNGGSLANGVYNLQFSLYTNATGGTAVAGPITTNGIFITNGLFTVTIDFGASVWNGQTNWLQLGVESNGIGSFTPLSPRQRVTPIPYAITAQDVEGAAPAGQLTSIGNTSGGSDNFFVGPSGNATTSGSFNTAIGIEALQDNTSGFYNTANGFQALFSNLNGAFNTANGTEALFSNTSGSGNTANGYGALYANTNGGNNTAEGAGALGSNTSGNANTADGAYSLNRNTSGNDNTAGGYEALYWNTNGTDNTAEGG